jgi:alpha-ketoglutarate-dependent taurine dioxygenase
VPEFVGDTAWSNLVSAYDGLSEPLRAFVHTLRAEHRYGGGDKPAGGGAYAKRVNDNLLGAIHPVVRVHPVTGEKALFLNPGLTTARPHTLPRATSSIST